MKFQSSLISYHELLKALETAKNIKLLDCTIDKVGKSLKGKKLEVLPNSLFFDIEGRFSDHTSSLPHTLVTPDIFEQEVQQLGINQDDTLILYDRWGIYSAPRAWWMFKLMGFEEVYILNGGVPTWKKNKLPLSTEYAFPEKKGNFKATFRPEWYADKEYILHHYKGKDITIFDARSRGRFTGLVPEPRKGLNGGHIPHSKNIPFEEILHDDKYVDTAEIQSIFKHTKPQGEEYVFTCGSGVTAAILAFASHLIGTEKIKVYDGSWSEWGIEELNLPIEK